MSWFVQELFYRSSEGPDDDSWEYEQRRVQDPPLLCLLGRSMDINWLRGLSKDRVDYGLAGHVMLIPGAHKPRVLPVPPLEDLWNKVVDGLQDVFEFWGTRGSTELAFTREGDEAWKASSAAVVERGHRDTLAAKLAVRHVWQMLKVAILFAALDKSPALDANHLKAAESFADFLYDSLRYLLAVCSRPELTKRGDW